MRPLQTLPLVTLLLACVACGTKSAAESPAAPAANATNGGATAVPDAQAPDAAPAPTGPLAFEAQEGWVREPTTSSMRAAQFQLPGAEGVGDATVVVFFFGAAGGGGFEANVARWAGQFEQPDGSPSLSTARESERRVAGMAVREVALEGTYVAETFPGSGQRVREENWALRGAMVDAPVGPYYIRLLGPAPAVERWEPSFRALLSGLGGAR